MGYRHEGNVYRLRFEGTGYEGLEIRMRSLSTGQLFKLETLKGQESSELDDILEMFVGKLISWNLEDETGAEVPRTIEGVKSQDLDFVLAIIDVWMRRVLEVPGPLSQASSGGGTSPVLSLPMEPLSQNQAS